ncbi:hypothetical protein BLNAU_7440 [Blattamonas nauphoetae]|uniref:Uncharacterized protein n=1 Tax=Blattamonas nauphoetae TaxID=2049346 RepID=A0ABQ9Y1C3_9EUKA|nr:hypothetical protein BLNAU_7440 [Blattamonas nauphoetae]
MSALDTNTSSSTDSACDDCSRFLNWDEEELESEQEIAKIFLSLVATVKLQSVLDDSLEAKALKILEYVSQLNYSSAEAFLGAFGPTTDESLRSFTQCIGVFISSASHFITTATMEMIKTLIDWCSPKVQLSLVKADLITRLINALNPLSLSFAETEDIHVNLMKITIRSLWLATPYGLYRLKVQNQNEPQAVHESVFQQVVAPSGQYICHLCTNRFSIVDGDQSKYFVELLARLLRISPYYQPTMEFVLNLPVFLTISSCLTFFEKEDSMWCFLDDMSNTELEWNDKGREVRRMCRTVNRMLSMEGIEDVIEEKLRNNEKGYGRHIVAKSIEWNNHLGMNLPEEE